MAKRKRGPVIDTKIAFPSYPIEMIVLRDEDGADSWYEAHEDLSQLSDGDLVGVYRLEEVRRVRVTTILEEQ